jgi:hypothetical protein
MTIHLSNYCLQGELDNTVNNCVAGWLRLTGIDTPLMLELAGNCDFTLHGRRICFARAASPLKPPADNRLAGLLLHQVGAAGNISWTGTDCDEIGTLTVNWFGQNGHIEFALDNLDVEIHDGCLSDLPAALQDVLDFAAPASRTCRWSPSLLRSESLLSDSEQPLLLAGLADETDVEQLCSFLDELSDGSHDVAIHELMSSPPRSEFPQGVNLDEIQEMLRDLLAQLALIGVGIIVCPHFSAPAVLGWLIDEVLFDEQVHPQLVQHSYVTYYTTSEYCQHCDVSQQEARNVGAGAPV